MSIVIIRVLNEVVYNDKGNRWWVPRYFFHEFIDKAGNNDRQRIDNDPQCGATKASENPYGRGLLKFYI